MRTRQASWLFAWALTVGGAAQAQVQDTPAPQADAPAGTQDVAPGAKREGVVHVNALKNPEIRAYRAIVAGLDSFDAHRALAPAVPRLLFLASRPDGTPLAGELPKVRLTADDFNLPLELGSDGRLAIPRSQAAWDAKAELELNRKKRQVRIEPDVRTPGLPDSQRRLGDIRLECLVKVAIAKAEIPFFWVMTIDGLLLSRDWCGWFNGDPKSKFGDARYWPVSSGAPLQAATLREGERRLPLKAGGHRFSVPLSDPSWSNDAIVELTYAQEPAPPAPTAALADARAKQDN
ncbi:hypothetical protein [Massilia sp. 9096]|uniref:hypothetical protein n=1 Tax=Massilia sp. 9096 TaxID=1500894 RepID=UPI0006899EEE|nr:hypothetical protein [Massilia sp. 9096]